MKKKEEKGEKHISLKNDNKLVGLIIEKLQKVETK